MSGYPPVSDPIDESYVPGFTRDQAVAVKGDLKIGAYQCSVEFAVRMRAAGFAPRELLGDRHTFLGVLGEGPQDAVPGTLARPLTGAVVQRDARSRAKARNRLFSAACVTVIRTPSPANGRMITPASIAS